ncbi:MAG: hypothetical protein H0Z33_14730 [Bacillaceae bacterium]|nr:hypothetical protein [Bacillaceae bacterium]
MKQSRWKMTAIGIMIVLGILTSTALAADSTGQPGSADDPIVTKSYVDQVKEEILQEVREGSPTQGTGSALVVEALNPGESIIGFSGTEFIVRTGTVTAIEGSNGDGLPDITSGTNISQGQTVAHNHLLLIPRDDGRGLKVEGNQTSYIMIRGEYTIPGREVQSQ